MDFRNIAAEPPKTLFFDIDKISFDDFFSCYRESHPISPGPGQLHHLRLSAAEVQVFAVLQDIHEEGEGVEPPGDHTLPQQVEIQV